MIKKSIHFIICIILINFLVHCKQKNNELADKEQVYSTKGSILNLLQRAKDKNETHTHAIDYATKALELSEKNKNDSLWFLSLHRLSVINYKKDSLLDFKKNSQLYLSKAIRNKDTNHIAKGNYKMGSYYLKTSIYDSAYFYFNHAKEIFRKQKDSLHVTANLLNMAIIQNSAGDYYGSEVTAIDALSFINTNNKKYALSLYNNLGNTSNELEQYQNALHWYNKSIELIKKEKRKIIVLNNIGIAYRNQKKHTKALSFLYKALNNHEINAHSSIKAMVIDNIGYVYFLMKNKQSLPLLLQAYKIRQEENSLRGIIVSQLHLGEYYLFKKDKKKAQVFFSKALSASIKIKDSKNKLKALLFLSKTTSQNSYIYDYAFLSDSINKVTQTLKNQFAKIKYRTKQKETENLILQQKYSEQSHYLEIQQNKKMRLGIIALSLLGILIAFLFYYRQKQDSQKQQLIIERLNARTEEKQMLSMHLHDDIASDILIGLQRADELQKQLKNKELENIISYLDKAYNKVRIISQRLSVLNFKKISFEKRINKLCNEYSFKADVNIKHIGLETIPWDTFQDEVKRAIYAIILEAFTNILKHAKATNTQVEFLILKKELHFSIKDNGIGYSEFFEKGIGLLNIEHRVDEMQGTFSINDTQPKGTEIKIILPKI